MDWLTGLLASIAVLLALWLAAVAVIWMHRPSRELALPAIRLLPEILGLVRRLLADPETPRGVKIALVGLGIWIASPIDLLPEFLPGIGALDDIVMAALVLRWVGRRLGSQRLRAAWAGIEEGFALFSRLL